MNKFELLKILKKSKISFFLSLIVCIYHHPTYATNHSTDTDFQDWPSFYKTVRQIAEQVKGQLPKDWTLDLSRVEFAIWSKSELDRFLITENIKRKFSQPKRFKQLFNWYMGTATELAVGFRSIFPTNSVASYYVDHGLVVFDREKLSKLNSVAIKEAIAHELTHVAQAQTYPEQTLSERQILVRQGKMRNKRERKDLELMLLERKIIMEGQAMKVGETLFGKHLATFPPGDPKPMKLIDVAKFFTAVTITPRKVIQDQFTYGVGNAVDLDYDKAWKSSGYRSANVQPLAQGIMEVTSKRHLYSCVAHEARSALGRSFRNLGRSLAKKIGLEKSCR